jgi:peptidoglycan/LPS O-acetylase OafA/YrhL
MYLPVKFACAFGVAACGYYYIEKPLTAFRQKLGKTTSNPQRKLI